MDSAAVETPALPRGPRWAAPAWVRGHPLPLVVCLQAALLFSSLSLLPVWTDELFTLQTAPRPVGEILSIVGRDIHPPLYFVLLHYWRELVLPRADTAWAGIAALRAFSALWAVLGTALLDLFWTRFFRPAQRWLALLLFALSPCLLLYGRMARSYSMQMALSLLALAMLQRWIQKPRSAALAMGALASVLALLYTHYLPGLALLAGFVLTSWRAIGTACMGTFLLAVGAGYAFWVRTLLDALGRWWQAPAFSSGYSITGNWLLEHVVKLGFLVVSMTVGESFFVLSLALVPVVVLLAIAGAKSGKLTRRIASLLAIAAAVGYVGASRWVSYPFIPARLLWLLPYLCILMALGISRIQRTIYKRGVVVLLLLSYASSDVLYFRRENFLNLGYTAPLPEIVATLDRQAQPADLILVDSYNTDVAVILASLSGRTRSLGIDPRSLSKARERIRSAASVWIVRTTRDISPEGITTQLQSEACAGRTRRVTLFEPYAPWQRMALKMVGSQPVPTHFYQLTECGPAGGTAATGSPE